jgi:hypothetical protein
MSKDANQFLGMKRRFETFWFEMFDDAQKTKESPEDALV